MADFKIEVEVNAEEALDNMENSTIVEHIGSGLLDEMTTTDIISYLEEDDMLNAIDDSTIVAYCVDNGLIGEDD